MLPIKPLTFSLIHPRTYVSMTGQADQFELMDCLDAGFDGYFLKPINLKVLYKLVEEAFDK